MRNVYDKPIPRKWMIFYPDTEQFQGETEVVDTAGEAQVFSSQEDARSDPRIAHLRDDQVWIRGIF